MRGSCGGRLLNCQTGSAADVIMTVLTAAAQLERTVSKRLKESAVRAWVPHQPEASSFKWLAVGCNQGTKIIAYTYSTGRASFA